MSKCIVKGSSRITVNGVNYYGGQSVELTSEQLEEFKGQVYTSENKVKVKPSITKTK